MTAATKTRLKLVGVDPRPPDPPMDLPPAARAAWREIAPKLRLRSNRDRQAARLLAEALPDLETTVRRISNDGLIVAGRLHPLFPRLALLTADLLVLAEHFGLAPEDPQA